MSSLIPDAAERPGDDPIFALNAIAQRRAAEGEEVINASLGALMEDDGSLAVMSTVTDAFRRVDPSRAAAYAPIAGDVPYQNAVVQDVFGTSALEKKAVAVATAGGTGAVHHGIVNFVEPGQTFLTTSYYWGPYAIIAKHTGRGIETFPMFDDEERFDLGSFESALNALLDRQGRALIILNFPCHNPTGYSLDEGEWRAVAEILMRAGSRGPVTLLLDLAYARYGGPGSDRWVEWLEPAVKHCTLLVAWSASKAFAQYGSRVGALIAVSDQADSRDQVFNALSYSCRGTWSNCNHLGMLAIGSLLSDPELSAGADRDRARMQTLLGERVAAFNQEAARAGLRTPRYEGGFFVAVFTDNAVAVSDATQEEGVFVVPLQGAVRVALCSTSVRDIPRLVASLARAIESVG